MTTAALELRHLRCERGERRLFDGVSASCALGSVLRVDGPNGSGKTSLLRMISGLSTPAAGDILWRGRPLRRDLADGPTTVFLGHSPALKGELTAIENLRAACALAGTACSDPDAIGALNAAGLRDHLRLPARSLSQGQRRRATLARLAIGPQADLWVLDEPFDALDAAARAWLQGLIGAHLARRGVVVLTSHERGPWDASLPGTTIRLGLPVPAAECTA